MSQRAGHGRARARWPGWARLLGALVLGYGLMVASAVGLAWALWCWAGQARAGAGALATLLALGLMPFFAVAGLAGVRSGFRAGMAWAHGWLGLVLGWLLLAMALAGSLSVYRAEIGDWTHGVPAGRPDTAQATAAAARWLAINAPRAPAWYITPADSRTTTTQALWADKDGTYAWHWLDAQSGSPAAIRQSLGGEFFFRLHFELQLPFPWGRWMAGLAALMLLVVLVTGVIAHARIFADLFTFRIGKGQRSWLDAHNLLGVMALPFHFMIALTGAVALANLILPWGAASLYGGNQKALYDDLYPATLDRTATGIAAPLVPLAPLLRDAQARFGSPIYIVTILNPLDRAALVLVTSNEDHRIGIERETLAYDGTTGQLLADHVERRAGLRAFNFAYGLHTARFAEPVLRALYFLCGLLLSGAIATGLVLWTVKRRQKVGGRGVALAERLNIGFVAGTPLAFAGFMLANRLIPQDAAWRMQGEVRTVFWLWALALVWAALRPARRGWVEVLGAAALACAGVAAVDMLTGNAALCAVTLGVDGVALLAAGALAYAARAMGRARAVAPRRRARMEVAA